MLMRQRKTDEKKWYLKSRKQIPFTPYIYHSHLYGKMPEIIAIILYTTKKIRKESL